MILFLNILPTAMAAGTYGLVGAAVFFIILLGAAVIAFKVLKQSVKMAFRLVIVAVILAVAVAGSVALWALGTSESQPPRPVPHNPR